MTTDAAPEGPGPGYCFVTGCPRSGTSALTRLLNAHPAVVIGEERYRLVVRDLAAAGRLDELGPELFEPERFLDVRVEESGYAPTKFGDQLERAAGRFRRRQVRWVGDKLIPPTRALIDVWAERFPGARVVFIHRDPVRVAASFQRRAEDPEDSWSARLTYRKAPRLWRQTVDALDHALDRLGPERVHVVAYEDLFSDDDAHLLALFAFLDLDPDRARPRWERSSTRARHHAPSGLRPRQEQWVRRHLRGFDPLRRAQDPRERLALLSTRASVAHAHRPDAG